MSPNAAIRTRRNAVTEGFIPFRGFRTWYRVVGEGDDPGKLPLLCLHGGPGMPHDYMEPLARMARTGRRVVFYDQLGCGRSDRPDAPALWTIDLFLDELRTVIADLGLDRYHLLGSSWGGMLAMEHALTQPDGLTSLVLASAPASIPQWIAEANRLRQDLRPDIQATLARHEADGTTNHPAYEAATMAFYRRHLCRLDPWPDGLNRTFAGMSAQVYTTMFGPSEFHATGLLQDWDITARLPEVSVPTLVTSGA
jgi:proline-specific peptidase